jgi:serine/threonine protein phosphatase PrpC
MPSAPQAATEPPATPPGVPAVPAAPADHGVVAHAEPGLLGLTVWTERRPGLGEDAEPLLLHHRSRRAGLLGVLDGSGGSGSGSAWTDPRGGSHTGAWVGSRVARLAAESWFTAQYEGAALAAGADELTDQLGTALRVLPDPSRSKIEGDMFRRLPTTMALLRYHQLDEAEVWVQSLWAGDSRGYCLRPTRGLQALTRDHTVERDALAQLTQDPPVTNVLCADRAFRVDEHQHRLLLPAVLLCATDGFFGYLQTPPDFEMLLLNTLASAADPLQWAELLSTQVSRWTGDDASLSLVALGYRDFAELRDSFSQRATVLGRLLAERPVQAQEAHRHWRQDVWERYQPDYEASMPPVPTAGSTR